ncbi:MAG: SDR family oxidoreductase [Verrucomicrobia bacterium]|nr:SDR family oxidoreductase [Verrucomicrobiota bacterium]
MEPLAWITGAGGLVGNALAQAAPQFAPDWRVLPLTRGQLDLADFATVKAAFQREPPQLVIHCAALSKTGACQQNPALARQLNVEVTARLAELAEDIPLIFFSSDLVFDGRRGNYSEADAVNPPNVYGETKAEAERIVLANPRHTVVRTSLNLGRSPTGDRAYNEELRRAWQAGQTATCFTDEFRCPIATGVTARAVWELSAASQPGLYHLAGAEKLSRWQLGELFAARCPQLQPKIRAASLKEFPGPPRAPDVSLDCAKIQRVLSFPLPRFSEWLGKNSEAMG